MTIRVIDSHTAGEPTRLVIAGGPDLGNGSLEERVGVFRARFDHFRSAIVNEPRGSDAMVGALLCPPLQDGSTAGVIFFNNVGYLGMCGHGTIGLVASLAYLGKIGPGHHRIETPVGTVSAELHESGDVTVVNVPSYRFAKDVSVDIAGLGKITGDIAWGGNWFFLVQGSPVELHLRNVDTLTGYTWRIREALHAQGICGAGGQEIEHIELFDDRGRNFVLCPGKAYDRSPCGTGTSAKLACLYSEGTLQPGEILRQESILGSVFEGRVEICEGNIYPFIKGSAFVNAEATLVFNEQDPFAWGIRS